MPFITEEIFCNLQDEEETIMLSNGLNLQKNMISPKKKKQLKLLKRQLEILEISVQK